MKNLRIATFNVNGLRARLPNLLQWLKREQPDIACLQELKSVDSAFPAAELEAAGYGAIWHGQASWNGVAILARDAQPLESRRGLPGDPDDKHSRYLEAAVHGVLVGCLYLPNGNPQPGPKFDYKLAWFERLIRYAKDLQSSDHPVVLAGDYNVVPTDMDIYNTAFLAQGCAAAARKPRVLSTAARSGLDGFAASSVSRGSPLHVLGLFSPALANQLRSAHRPSAAQSGLSPYLHEAGVDAWVRNEPHASDHAPTWIRIGSRKRR
jgi:exodeoxyribonuclease-3